MRRARVLVLCTLGWVSKVAGVAVPQCPPTPVSSLLLEQWWSTEEAPVTASR